MQIILLTHEREVTRPSNTGQLALECFPDICTRIIWARTSPDAALVKQLQTADCALLFPEEVESPSELAALVSSSEKRRQPASVEHDEQKSEPAMPSTLVILDATWQEARKMLRRSDYLKNAQKYSISSKHDSQFTLRRNQVDGGLCTAECIIELFKEANMPTQAAQLAEKFALMQK
ncbi:DTW domain-containing protein [Shewanella gelidimarina]|uniref:tRNA-uridine aminocarboxypropyltransferase n=1 Tax=Shewanella gelidimarina TaxID=56813 RepID=UPI002010B863|nr:tRNA-uridine aminocarboxypropyltransferase [Shewanella gelidimarina]MCL1060405.1 DTW domain-containing protein [Shewanella gelidimarina]